MFFPVSWDHIVFLLICSYGELYYNFSKRFMYLCIPEFLEYTGQNVYSYVCIVELCLLIFIYGLLIFLHLCYLSWPLIFIFHNVVV